jgi:hypothetical protein
VQPNVLHIGDSQYQKKRDKGKNNDLQNITRK